MTGVAASAGRPPVVPAELAPAWDLLERAGVAGIVVDADDVLWPALPAGERHRQLAARLREDDGLHASFSPEAFAVVRSRAGERAGTGARLADVWADIPEWCHPGRTRAELVELELAAVLRDTVPDPDLALLLAAAAEARVPVAAVSHGLLTADQVRRRLEHPTLDAVTWRTVAVAQRDDDPLARAIDAVSGAAGAVLVVSSRPVPARPGTTVVALGDPRRPTETAAVRRVAARLATSDELRALPQVLRPAWIEGATVLGPVLTGFAEWVVRHASGHAGATLHCVTEPRSLLETLLLEQAAARELDVRIAALPLTAELLAAADAAGSPVAAALTVALGAEHESAEVAGILGVPDAGGLPSLVSALTDDTAVQDAASRRADELRAALDAATAQGDGPAPLVLCLLGGSGGVQARLASLLRAQGVPRHAVGLQLLSDAPAADAALGTSGGEVHGYLANLGVPAAAHAAAAAWRSRLEAVAGAPDRGRTSLGPLPPTPDDLAALTLEATRRGVLAHVRQALRLRHAAGDVVDLLEAGPWLAAGLPALPPVPTPAVPADALTPPPWVAGTVAVLERELAGARAEVARRDVVVASRVYRAASRARRLLARLRSR